MEDDRPDLVPLAAAADRLELSTEAVRKRIQRGTLPGRKVGGAWFVEARHLPLPPPSGRQDDDDETAVQTGGAGRQDGQVRTPGPLLDGGRTTAPAPPVDLAPLAELIERLHGENQRLTEAATAWQIRALRAEERVLALEAGPEGGGDAATAAQDALLTAPAAPRAPEPAGAVYRASRWWRRLLGR